ncbi:MAG: hypothetical protein EA409_06400 [Saprospirales bacterium]|nr:MAG: hypothetical protein EA409_06400 [Saprospirales bacterium]
MSGLIGILKSNIPNILTIINLMAGLTGILLTVKGDIEWVFVCLTVGLVADLLDGMTARLLGVSGPLGVQLDSLADLITFGVFPVVLFYFLQIDSNHLIPVALGCLIYTSCAALRLAKFNIIAEPSSEFSGLPSPAAGLLVMAVCYNIIYYDGATWISELPTLAFVATIVVIALLMVSPLTFQSLKFKGLGFIQNKWKYLILLLGAAIFLIFGLNGLVYIMLMYIGISLLSNFFRM